MSFSKLNPQVYAAAMKEVIYRNEERIAYDARLFYMVSGEISITIYGKKSNLSGGNLIYIPAGTSYKLKGQHFLMAAISFDLTADYEGEDVRLPVTPDAYDKAFCHASNIPPFDKVIRLDDADEEREFISEMCEIAISSEGEWRAELSAMLKLVLLRIAAKTDERALPSRMIRNLDLYIRENRKDDISNTEIGAIFGYHPFYVSNKLKESKGITLRQYIINYRLKLARTMLENTPKSIAEIADEAGFTDASYFTKSFKSVLGMTPKEYRSKLKDKFI